MFLRLCVYICCLRERKYSFLALRCRQKLVIRQDQRERKRERERERERVAVAMEHRYEALQTLYNGRPTQKVTDERDVGRVAVGDW